MPKKRSRKQGTKKARKRASEPSPSRWEVKVVLEALDEATFYVSGRDQAEAEEAADREFSRGGIYEFERIWSEYTLEVSQIQPHHDAYPVAASDGKGSICKMCLRAVRWTGIAADDPGNRSGKTIPGPWVHAPPSSLTLLP